MTETKTCPVCGTQFAKNRKYSATQWERATFCSNLCRGRSIKFDRSLCACGCGQRVRKLHARWRQGHNPHRHKSLQIRTTSGKTRWFTPTRSGKLVQFAKVVMEDHLGRELLSPEVVHHINGDSTDDRIENLRLYASHAEHMRDEYRAGRLPAMH